MRQKTLNIILEGMRATHRDATVHAIRWMNKYVITMLYAKDSQPLEYQFLDHEYMHGEAPALVMADMICSLPWPQQIPFMGPLKLLMDDHMQRTDSLRQLNSMLEDMKLHVLALKHDLESTKREKQALIEKYEKKI